MKKNIFRYFSKPINYHFSKSKIKKNHQSAIELTEKYFETHQISSSDYKKAYPESNSNKHILDCLKREGLCILPNYANEYLPKLDLEFEEAFSGTSDLYKQYSDKLDMMEVITPKDNNRITEKFDVFFSAKLKNLVHEYFKAPHYFNDPIFLHHSTYNEGIPILPCHFDGRNNLKFFLYLDDTSTENGALSFIPKTTPITNSLLKKCDEIGLRARCRPNSASFHKVRNKSILRFHSNRADMVSFPIQTTLNFKPKLLHVNEKKGTLIIFDTNTLHRGGIISKNKQRRIIRTHCQLTTERESY